MRHQHKVVWCDAPTGGALLLKIKEKGGWHCAVSSINDADGQTDLHKSGVIALLDSAVVENRLMMVPFAKERELRQMVSMELQAEGHFQQQFGFDYQVVENMGQQLLIFCVYTRTEILAEVRRRIGEQGWSILRVATVYDGLLALCRQSDTKVDKGASVVFYWRAQQLTLLVIHDGKPWHGQVVSGIIQAEQVVTEYVRTMGALSRQYNWALGQEQLYGLVAVNEGQSILKKQLSALLELPISWLEEAAEVKQWQMTNDQLVARALLEEA